MKINNIAVIGAGTMGHGIAQVFALAGLQVALTDSDAKVLGKAIQRIQVSTGSLVQKILQNERGLKNQVLCLKFLLILPYLFVDMLLTTAQSNDLL